MHGYHFTKGPQPNRELYTTSTRFEREIKTKARGEKFERSKRSER